MPHGHLQNPFTQAPWKPTEFSAQFNLTSISSLPLMGPSHHTPPRSTETGHEGKSPCGLERVLCRIPCAMTRRGHPVCWLMAPWDSEKMGAQTALETHLFVEVVGHTSLAS